MVYIPVIFMGGQYNSLIALQIEKAGARTELKEPTISSDVLSKADGLVLGGGPWNLPDDMDKMGSLNSYLKEPDIPILGVCLGLHLISIIYGGSVAKAAIPEFGQVAVKIIEPESPLFRGFPPTFQAWASHNDEVVDTPKDFNVIASSDNCKVQSMAHKETPIWGIQFHAEVTHTPLGGKLFQNFVDFVNNFG